MPITPPGQEMSQAYSTAAVACRERHYSILWLWGRV